MTRRCSARRDRNGESAKGGESASKNFALSPPFALSPFLVGVFLFAVTQASPAAAQTSYPMLTHVFPAGVQRGTTAEVTVSGTHDFAGAYKVLFEGEGLTAEIVPPAAPVPASCVSTSPSRPCGAPRNENPEPSELSSHTAYRSAPNRSANSRSVSASTGTSSTSSRSGA